MENYTIDSLPNRVNSQAVVFRGLTFSELVKTICSGLIVFLPSGMLIMSMFGYAILGLGLGVFVTMIYFFIVSAYLTRLKRNKGTQEAWLYIYVMLQKKGFGKKFNLASTHWDVNER